MIKHSHFSAIIFFRPVVFGFAVEIGVFSVLNFWVFPKLFPLESDKLSGFFLKRQQQQQQNL